MYFGQIDQHFPEVKSYVLADIADTKYPRHTFIRHDDSTPYYQQWIEGLEKVETDYFIYMQEDFVLYNRVDVDALQRYIKFLDEADSGSL